MKEEAEVAEGDDRDEEEDTIPQKMQATRAVRIHCMNQARRTLKGPMRKETNKAPIIFFFFVHGTQILCLI